MLADTMPPPTPAQNPYVPIPPRVRQGLLLFGAVYGLFILIGTLFKVDAEGPVMLLVGLSGVFLVFCLLVPIIFPRAEYGYFHPLVFTSLFAFANLIVKQTGGLVNGLPFHFYIVGRPPEELQMIFAYGNFLKGIALLATYAGFLWVRKPALRSLGLVSQPHRYWLWVIAAVFGVALVALFLYARSYGGLANFLLSLAKSRGVRAEMRDTEDEGVGQFAVPIFATAVAMLLWVAARRDALRDVRFYALLAASCVMGFALGGKRSVLLLPAILVGCAWMISRRKVPMLRLALAGVVIFFIIGLVGIFRWSNEKRSEFSLDFLSDISLADVAGASAGEMAVRSGAISTYYSILAEVPEKVPFRFGMTYVEYLAIFIPRSLWPDKPRGVDTQAGRTFADADWGMPPGAVGEAYWNGHIPGVLVIFFLFGGFLRIVGTFFERNATSPAVVAFYVLTIYTLSPTQNSVRGWIQNGVPLLMIAWAMGLFRRQRRPASPRAFVPAIR